MKSDWLKNKKFYPIKEAKLLILEWLYDEGTGPEEVAFAYNLLLEQKHLVLAKDDGIEVYEKFMA